MTATDELRRLLDERGVKWSATVGANGTIWTHWDAFNGHRVHAMDNEDGTVEIFDQWFLTPAQAVEATLGQEDTYTREDVESAFVRGYSLGSLPVGSDPRWDENRQTVDEHMADLGWVRAAATPGAWTCEVDGTIKRDWDRCEPYWEHELSCGHTATTLEPDPPRFCPSCGREVER